MLVPCALRGGWLAYLGAELVDLSALMSCDDVLPQRSPHGAGDLGLAAGHCQVRLVVLYSTGGQNTRQPGNKKLLRPTLEPWSTGLPTYLLGVSQVKVVEKALVAHLLVCGEHDDVAAEVEATCPDSRAGLQQSQLFTWDRKGDYEPLFNQEGLSNRRYPASEIEM